MEEDEKSWEDYVRSLAKAMEHETPGKGSKTVSPIDILQLDLPGFPSPYSSSRGNKKVSNAKATGKGKRGSSAVKYRDFKSQDDLREENLKLRKQVQAAKKEATMLRTQLGRLQHKMKEKDANIHKILAFQISNKKDSSGYAMALRNEKLLVQMLLKKVSTLESDAKKSDNENQAISEELKELQAAKKHNEILQEHAAQMRDILEARAAQSHKQYEEEIARMSDKYFKLQQRLDILSTQHLAALKALDTVNAQREAVRAFRQKIRHFQELAKDNVDLRREVEQLKKEAVHRKFSLPEDVSPTHNLDFSNFSLDT